MTMMCVTSSVTASKNRLTGAKLHNAGKRVLTDWRYKTVAAPTDIDEKSIPIASVTQRAAQCRNMDSEVVRSDK
jgi:hypothetical protein